VFTDYESLALYYSCHHVYTEAEAAANEGVVAGTCEPGREAVYFLSRKPSPIHVLLRMYSVTLRKLCVLPANMELINHYCEFFYLKYWYLEWRGEGVGRKGGGWKCCAQEALWAAGEYEARQPLSLLIGPVFLWPLYYYMKSFGGEREREGDEDVSLRKLFVQLANMELINHYCELLYLK
jgi:hypothetical protein